MDLTNLLASNNYIIVNKILIKELGLEEAILFGELASEYSYWKEREKLEDDYFFSTMENIEKNTCLSSYKQRKLIEKLKNEGLISTKIQGIPAKRYIKINEELVIKKLNIKLLKNLTSSSKKNEQLDVEKFNTNNNKLKNNNNNNNINIYTPHAETTQKNKKTKHKYGEYQNVLLTDDELKKLNDDYSNTNDLIKFLDEYIEMKGYKAKSHYLCIKKWVVDAVKERSKKFDVDAWVRGEIDG